MRFLSEFFSSELNFVLHQVESLHFLSLREILWKLIKKSCFSLDFVLAHNLSQPNKKFAYSISLDSERKVLSPWSENQEPMPLRFHFISDLKIFSVSYRNFERTVYSFMRNQFWENRNYSYWIFNAIRNPKFY